MIVSAKIAKLRIAEPQDFTYCTDSVDHMQNRGSFYAVSPLVWELALLQSRDLPSLFFVLCARLCIIE
jgi:hypothetical protein